MILHIPRSAHFALGAFILGFLMMFIWHLQFPYHFLKPINLYDEGVSLLGAARVADGEVPYRDFWTMYPPFKFLSLGLVFKIFGSNLWIGRVFFALVSLLGFGALYLFLWRQRSLLWAIVGTTVLSLFATFSLTPTLLLCLSLAFTQLLHQPSLLRAGITGLLGGCLLLLRWDFGGTASLAVLSLFLFFAWRTKMSHDKTISMVGAAGGGLALVVLPVIIWLTSQGALPEMINQTLFFPLGGEYLDLRWLPMLTIDPLNAFYGESVNIYELSRALQWYFPLLALLLAGKTWLAMAHKKIAPWQEILPGILWGILVLTGILYATHRADDGHLLFLNSLSTILLLLTTAKWRQISLSVAILPFVAIMLFQPVNDFMHNLSDLRNASKEKYIF